MPRKAAEKAVKAMTLELIWIFFQIGLFSFGGGYAAVSLIQQQVVEERGWLTLAEFANIVTIAEATPGPVGINAATFTGMKIGGILGATVATVSYVLPSFFIVLLLAYLFNKYKSLSVVQGVLSGVRPSIVGLIAAVGVTLTVIALFNGGGIKDINSVTLIIFAASFTIFTAYKKISPAIIILGSGLVGIAAHFLHLI